MRGGVEGWERIDGKVGEEELTKALKAWTGLAPGRGTETITVILPIWMF